MPERYRGYDVLAKRDTPSWNDATREVIDARLAVVDAPEFLDEPAWRTLRAICDRVAPRPATRATVPVAALIDRKLARDQREGWRDGRLPPLREAWRRGLAALEAAAQARAGVAFHALMAVAQDALLRDMQRGELAGSEWDGMPCEVFFKERVLHDVLTAYYSHPSAWNEIGFGGPASPRGYVRMYFNRRDPWEAVEGEPGLDDLPRTTDAVLKSATKERSVADEAGDGPGMTSIS